MAQATFRNALCVCQGLVTSYALATNAFDSDLGPYTDAGAHSSGSVGFNATLTSSRSVDVGGSLVAAGGVSIDSLVVHDDLACSGALQSQHDVRVNGDALDGSDITVFGHLTVIGTLTFPVE